MAVMTEQRLLPADRPLTIADLDDTPDDGQRYELDDGVLVVSAAPMVIHQIVLTRLEVLLDAACAPEFLIVGGRGCRDHRHAVPDPAWWLRADSVAIADKTVSAAAGAGCRDRVAEHCAL